MLKLHKTTYYFILSIFFTWTAVVFYSDIVSLIKTPTSFGFIQLIYVLAISLAFWLLFYLDLVDFIYSRSGKNGNFFLSFSKSIQKDMVVAVAVGIVLLSIYWSDKVQYSFSGIDIGASGVPFLISSIYISLALFKLRIKGLSLNRIPIITALSLKILLFAVFYYLLLTNSSGEFQTHQAIWVQLTVLFASFSIYTRSHLNFKMLAEEWYEVSPFTLFFINKVTFYKFSYINDIDSSFKKINKENGKATYKK